MSTPSSTDLVDTSSRLVAAFGASDAAFAGVLLEVLNRLGAGVAVKEIATGRYVHVNARMAALFGRTAADMPGTADADLMAPGPAALLRAADQAAVAQLAALAAEHRLELGGQRREFSVTRLPIPCSGDTAPSHLCCVWTETTQTHQRDALLQKLLVQLEQQQAANEALRRESRDPSAPEDTMGLYQRAHFDDQLRREVDLSAREHRQFSLVSIVLDPLTSSVLELGAEGRARVLEALGRLLRSNTRAMDASCRVDADRFAVLLSGVGLATAHSRMEGLRRQCATQIVAVQGRELGFTVAMGVASFPHTASTQQALTEAADAALTEAVRRGGNHVALAGIRFEQN